MCLWVIVICSLSTWTWSPPCCPHAACPTDHPKLVWLLWLHTTCPSPTAGLQLQRGRTMRYVHKWLQHVWRLLLWSGDNSSCFYICWFMWNNVIHIWPDDAAALLFLHTTWFDVKLCRGKVAGGVHSAFNADLCDQQLLKVRCVSSCGSFPVCSVASCAQHICR